MAEKKFRSFTHLGNVQGSFEMPCQVPFNNGRRRAADYPVRIEFVDRRKARMEIFADLFGGNYRDRLRLEMGVDRFGKVPAFQRPVAVVQVKVRYLSSCMHPGIRTPRNMQTKILLAEFRYCFLNRLLDRRAIFLSLPSGVVSTQILYCQFPADHV